MASKQYTQAELRAALERNAQFDHNSRVVLTLVRRREAGLARQMTTEEIAAQMERDRANPPRVIQHSNGQSHIASYRCCECQ